MSERRVTVQWTRTALDALKKLPPKVRRGIWNKADQLRECDDPTSIGKPLLGPLEGYFRIVYSRYRAIYSCEEEVLPNGDVLTHIIVRFVAVGQRKAGDKNDVYQFAMKLLRLGALDEPGEQHEEE